MLFFALYGGTAATALLLCLYLLLSKVNVIAPGVTPPVSLRRWAAALFGVVAISDGYWLLAYAYGFEEHSWLHALLAMLDGVGLLITLFGTMLSMLQDCRRPLWPFAAATVPIVVLGVLQTARTDVDFMLPLVVYMLSLYTIFTVYMIITVRQYQRWLRDHYADLEHKEVWVSLTLLIVVLLLMINYGFADNYTSFVLVHLTDFALFAFLLWRVETLPTLDEALEHEDDDLLPEQDILPEPDFLPGLAQEANAGQQGEAAGQPLADIQSEAPTKEIIAPNSRRRKAGDDVLSRIGQLLEKECVGTQLYLKPDLTLSQLSAAVGVNRNYLGQYFASQGTTYYNYIHDLRIRHFMRLCREAVAAGRSFKAQQLALESGFRSYSTFALAFKQRTGKSVTAWVSDLEAGANSCSVT